MRYTNAILSAMWFALAILTWIFTDDKDFMRMEIVISAVFAAASNVQFYLETYIKKNVEGWL